jgi:hypothetical protein
VVAAIGVDRQRSLVGDAVEHELEIGVAHLGLPVRVQQLEATVQVDPGDDHRGVGPVAGFGPLTGPPRRVLPEVEACPEPFEVLVAGSDVACE